jgi:hypothetical protein
MTGNAAYFAFWTSGVFGCGTPPGNIETGGLEIDITEDYSGGDSVNFVYGGYGGNPTDCPGNTRSGGNGTNLADGSFHLMGARIVLGAEHSTCKYADGSLVFCFTQRSDGLGGAYNGAPTFTGGILMYAWGVPGNTGGETDYDWIRVYRAQ